MISVCSVVKRSFYEIIIVDIAFIIDGLDKLYGEAEGNLKRFTGAVEEAEKGKADD